MTERWLVVQTQPKREQWAAENITRLGFEFYFPRIQTIHIVRGVKLARTEPLFHRHLFVRSDEGQWRFLTGTFGVTGVIMCGESPGFLHEREIARLKRAEDLFGIVILPEYQKAPKFRDGQSVKVSSGPMAGYGGIYQGTAPKDRVKVLLSVMGRKTQILISDELLEAV